MVDSSVVSSAGKKAVRWAAWKAEYSDRTMADYSGLKKVALLAAKTEMNLAAPMDMSKAVS